MPTVGDQTSHLRRKLSCTHFMTGKCGNVHTSNFIISIDQLEAFTITNCISCDDIWVCLCYSWLCLCAIWLLRLHLHGYSRLPGFSAAAECACCYESSNQAHKGHDAEKSVSNSSTPINHINSVPACVLSENYFYPFSTHTLPRTHVLWQVFMAAIIIARNITGASLPLFAMPNTSTDSQTEHKNCQEGEEYFLFSIHLQRCFILAPLYDGPGLLVGCIISKCVV